MLTLDIPEATPSINRFRGEHWTQRHRRRTHWAWLVRCARMDAGVASRECAAPRGSQELIRVVVDRWGKRELDQDNFIAGCKELMDALVAEGLLEDDSPAHVAVTYRQHFGAPRTLITLDRAPP